MQTADTPVVAAAIQTFLADASRTELCIFNWADPILPRLTVIDASCIIECARAANARLDAICICGCDIHNDAVLNVFLVGLPLCTSLTEVKFMKVNLGNEDLDHLLPAFFNTAVTKLAIGSNNIQGPRGGEVITKMLVGNKNLLELDLTLLNRLGVAGGRALARVFAVNDRLQKLDLGNCQVGNDGLANLLPADDVINTALTELKLCVNRIEGAEGGRQVALLLQRLAALKVLILDSNPLFGSLGAAALAPGLTAASHLESLALVGCGLGNDGVTKLVPDGQVNRALVHLDLRENNAQDGECLVTLAARGMNLDSIGWNSRNGNITLNPDQQRRLELLLERKCLCTAAQARAGSSFPVLFRVVEVAHRHEHGLGAIFVILLNDGDDHFCNANNRAIE
jgi:Leucine Rich repeat